MALLATKLEMTRVVKDDRFVPVTLLQVPAVKVIGIKTEEENGYNAVIIGICGKNESTLKEWKKTLSVSDFKNVSEFHVDDTSKYAVWDEVNLESLEWVEAVHVESFSKWKWFTWAMKKHNFHGWPAGHGSKFHRALGSIWNRKPTRTHKWKKMHGHHGNVKKTLKNLPLEIINKELGVIGIRWPIPGGRKSVVKISF